MKAVFLIAVVGVVAAGCDEGELVAFNQRLYDLQSPTSRGAGCSIYGLGGGAQNTSTASAGDFLITERLAGDEVVVEVTRDSVVLASKRYGAPFFRAGTVDEYTVMPEAGSGLRLRQWGAFSPEGPAGCTPLVDDGPR